MPGYFNIISFIRVLFTYYISIHWWLPYMMIRRIRQYRCNETRSMKYYFVILSFCRIVNHSVPSCHFLLASAMCIFYHDLDDDDDDYLNYFIVLVVEWFDVGRSFLFSHFFHFVDLYIVQLFIFNINFQ